MKNKILGLTRLLKEETGKIISGEIELPNRAVATITRASVSNDLKTARIFISVLGNKYQEEEIFRTLKACSGKIQHILNKRLRIKFVPKITFLKEKYMEEEMRMEELLEKLEEK